MIKLLKNLKPIEWLMIFVSFALIVGQVFLDLKLPDYMKDITEQITGGANSMGEIWKSGGFMLACALGSGLLSVAVGFFAAKIAAGLGLKLRFKIFSKIQDFSKTEMKKFSTASLITRTTNDVSQVQMMLALSLQVIVKAPTTAIWAIVKITGKSWQWSLVTAISVVILLITIILIIGFCLPKFKVMQKQTDEINRVSRENLTGLRVIRAFNAEEYHKEKFEKVNDDLYKTHLFIYRRMMFFNPVISLVMSGLSLAIYWVGAYIINSASLFDKFNLFSDMIIFSSYAMQIILSFMLLVMVFVMLPRAIVSARRINEVLSYESSIKDGEGVLPKEEGTVEFKNVSFKYPDAQEYVLKNISFTAKKGETVAFIGSTGSGKSTLVDLIPRFYDATSGTVYVDG